MSDFEKTRAATLLSAFVLAFALLSAYRNDAFGPSMQAVDPVELCGATRGSLCEGVAVYSDNGHRLASSPVTVNGQAVAELGQMIVSASRLSPQEEYRLQLAAAYGFDTDNAILGSMIVSGTRLSASTVPSRRLRLAEGSLRETGNRGTSVLAQ